MVLKLGNLLIFSSLFLLSEGASQQFLGREEAEANITGMETIHVVSFNDFHGRLGVRKGDDGSGMRMAKALCQLVNVHRLDAENALLVSAGDNFGASGPVSNIGDELPTIRFLNSLGLNFSVVGNHEFDEGSRKLFARLDPAQTVPIQWQYLGANVQWEANNTLSTPLKAYGIVELRGIRIGIVGVVTSHTKDFVLASGVADIHFGNMAEAVKEVTNSPEIQRTDVLILLVHDGFGSQLHGEENVLLMDAALSGNEDLRALVRDAFARFDLILSAHTHQVYSVSIQDRPCVGPGARSCRPELRVVQTGSYGRYLALSTIDVSKTRLPHTRTRASVRTRLVPVSGSEACEPESPGYPSYFKTRNIMQSIREDFEQSPANTLLVGISPRRLTCCLEVSQDDECELANLIADTLRAYGMKENEKTLFMEGNDGVKLIGLANWGSIRDALPQGEVRKEDLLGMMPFKNVVEIMRIERSVLKKLLVLEAPRLMGVSGVEYDFQIDPVSGIYEVELRGDDTAFWVASCNFLIERAKHAFGGESEVFVVRPDHPDYVVDVFMRFLSQNIFKESAFDGLLNRSRRVPFKA